MKKFLPLLCTLPLVLLAQAAPNEVQESAMTYAQALLLGVTEGVTEFLPISSTGHLLLAERLLNISDTPESARALDTYMIVIQLGAILAVAWVYHDYLKRIILGLLGKDTDGLRLFRNLMIAFIPAALVGILFVDIIKESLFNLWVVSFAWLVGGVALVIWGKKTSHEADESSCTLASLSTKKALGIGAMQVIAMWPGTSRSLITILGGKWVGLSLKDSVLFSFLLGLVTLTASTAYDMVRNGEEMIRLLGADSLIIGLIAAYLSAWVAVRGMVHYLRKHGMGLFGGYRIVLACITVGLLLSGWVSA